MFRGWAWVDQVSEVSTFKYTSADLAAARVTSLARTRSSNLQLNLNGTTNTALDGLTPVTRI